MRIENAKGEGFDIEIPEGIFPEESKKNAEFFSGIIGLLEAALRSEDPKDYGVNQTETLDIFAWDMVEDAKKSNINIRQAIEKLEEKLKEIKPKFGTNAEPISDNIPGDFTSKPDAKSL